MEPVWFCAEECLLQQTGPLEVARMYDAFVYATECNEITIPMILNIGSMIDGRNFGWRRVPVHFSNMATALKPDLIDRAIVSLVGSTNLHPDAWYLEFEKIHPFIDGNGRAGAILWNWLSGTMNDPELPPDMFDRS